MDIKAYAVPEKGAAPVPFTYRTEVGAHDVLVKLTHRSLTRGDLQMIENDWGDTRFPLVPSHEMVGIVERTGNGVTELKPGDRVGVGYQLNACFECSYCGQGTEQFCSRQTVVGVHAYGGLAEHIVVDARFAFPLPPQLAPAPSTPLMSSGLTVFAAITHAQLPRDARVAVLGIGGLGRLALRFLLESLDRSADGAAGSARNDRLRPRTAAAQRRVVRRRCRCRVGIRLGIRDGARDGCLP